MEWTREQLLQPSLGGSRGRAPYSGTMIFLSAFFGGPLAALASFALNVLRLERAGRDALPLVLAALSTVLVLALLQGTAWQGTLVLRMISLALALLGLWRHRLEQRAADLMGSERPNGLWIGLGLIVFGHLLTPVLEKVLR